MIAAGTTQFTAQCPNDRLHEPPEFGQFVKILPPGAQEPSGESPAAPDYDPFADPAPVGSLTLPAGTPDEVLYALVYSASTGSFEPGRRPTAYGLDEDQLRAEQPQIFDLLATEFSALHVGYAQKGVLRPNLPPRPPRLHAFVRLCTDQEICVLTESPELLRRLLKSAGLIDQDELIAACLRHAYLCRGEDFDFLVRAGKQLANCLRDDPERLSALLLKLEP